MERVSERVIRMKQNFMQLHNNGKTIKEIAEIYNLHYTTVYDYLQEIADANNMTRTDLLTRVIIRTSNSNSKNKSTNTTSIDFKEIDKSFDVVTNELSNLIQNIDLFSKEFFQDDKEEE